MANFVRNWPVESRARVRGARRCVAGTARHPGTMSHVYTVAAAAQFRYVPCVFRSRSQMQDQEFGTSRRLINDNPFTHDLGWSKLRLRGAYLHVVRLRYRPKRSQPGHWHILIRELRMRPARLDWLRARGSPCLRRHRAVIIVCLQTEFVEFSNTSGYCRSS